MLYIKSTLVGIVTLFTEGIRRKLLLLSRNLRPPDLGTQKQRGW